MDNLSKLTEAKGAEVELRFASEDVWRLLTAAQSGIRRRHDAPGIGFWILVLGTALVAAMAAATGAIMLREARTSARGWL